MNSIAPANYLLNSFKSLGCEVFLVSDVPHPDANLVRTGSIDVSEIVTKRGFKPDLLLFVEGGEMGIFPINFFNLSFPKYWWGIDTHNDYKKHLRISRLFDHSFIAQKNFVQSLKQDGIKSVSWLALAYPENDLSLGPRNLDVSYVGSTNWDLYPERGTLLSIITQNHPTSFIGTAEPLHMFEIYHRSKIVFNYSLKNDLNMRFFEAMGSGALLITNQIIDNGVDEIFRQGEDFIFYFNSEDLLSKLQYLLNNSVELERVARNGMLKVRSEHTYRNRAAAILKFQPEVDLDTQVDTGNLALVLVSMGLYSDSISSFLSTLKVTPTGRRNKLVLMFIGPLISGVVIGAKFLEFIARRMKRNQ